MKTSYFSKAAGIPGAISIARYPPKWFEGLQFPRLAPTGDMIHMHDMVQYSRLYQIRILGKLDPEKVYDGLVKMAYPNEPILLCFEKEPEYCHRRLVAEWFERHLDIKVKELGVQERYDPQMRLF